MGGGDHALTCGSAVFLLKGFFFPFFQKSDLPEMPAPHFFLISFFFLFFGKDFTSRKLYKNFKLISLKKRRSACEGGTPLLLRYESPALKSYFLVDIYKLGAKMFCKSYIFFFTMAKKNWVDFMGTNPPHIFFSRIKVFL